MADSTKPDHLMPESGGYGPNSPSVDPAPIPPNQQVNSAPGPKPDTVWAASVAELLAIGARLPQGGATGFDGHVGLGGPGQFTGPALPASPPGFVPLHRRFTTWERCVGSGSTLLSPSSSTEELAKARVAMDALPSSTIPLLPPDSSSEALSDHNYAELTPTGDSSAASGETTPLPITPPTPNPCHEHRMPLPPVGASIPVMRMDALAGGAIPQGYFSYTPEQLGLVQPALPPVLPPLGMWWPGGSGAALGTPGVRPDYQWPAPMPVTLVMPVACPQTTRKKTKSKRVAKKAVATQTSLGVADAERRVEPMDIGPLTLSGEPGGGVVSQRAEKVSCGDSVSPKLPVAPVSLPRDTDRTPSPPVDQAETSDSLSPLFKELREEMQASLDLTMEMKQIIADDLADDEPPPTLGSQESGMVSGKLTNFHSPPLKPLQPRPVSKPPTGRELPTAAVPPRPNMEGPLPLPSTSRGSSDSPEPFALAQRALDELDEGLQGAMASANRMAEIASHWVTLSDTAIVLLTNRMSWKRSWGKIGRMK